MHIHVQIAASSAMVIQKMEKGHAQRSLHCRSLEALSTIDPARDSCRRARIVREIDGSRLT
jgi:hypothetical protein